MTADDENPIAQQVLNRRGPIEPIPVVQKGPDPETVPCKYCSTPTQMTGTQLCDNCWEVSSRIGTPRMPKAVLEKILEDKGITIP